MSSCAVAVRHRAYQRHRPEQTVLHAIVREHLAGFLRHADEHYARPLPKYVRRTFDHYLRCGLPEHGFLRLRCDDCGHDRVVAFCCKERGVCPSCAGRTMTNTAAHLVDRVLPNVPIRQWVLSVPFDLRAVAARNPSLVTAVDRALFREVERWMRRTAGPSEARAGAVTFVQRFGGSLNLHVHFHVLFLEGLFTCEPERLPVFHQALTPTRADLLEVLQRVRASVLRWMTRHGLATENPDDDADIDAIDACANAAIQPGLFDRLAVDANDHAVTHDEDEPIGIGRQSVSLDGFNLHAAVRVGADDDVARERLVRYCARPPFALERLSVLRDGRIAYQIKQPRKNATHRLLTPFELLARIAALIPPPRHPFLRYHGVLAPNSRWRSAIVPRAPNELAIDEAPARPPGTAPVAHASPATPAAAPPSSAHDAASAPAADPIARTSSTHPGLATRTSSPSRPARSPFANQTTPRALEPQRGRAAFSVITEAHRARLADGALLAHAPRLEWSKLLRRTYAADVLVCPRCQGRARVIAVIQDPTAAARFLAAIDQQSTTRASGAGSPEDDDDSQLPPPSSRAPDLPIPDD